MNTTLFISTLSALMAVYTFFAVRASRQVHTTQDYFLAGKNLGFWQVTFTLLATQIGGGMLLGTAQQAYHVGVYGILYCLSMVIGFFILGLGVAARLQSFNISTTAQLFETHYGSKTLKQIASLLSIATLCGILTSQIVASKTLLSAFGVNNELFFVGFWLFIIGYTMLGGLHAVIVADTYQVIYILTVFTGVGLYALLQESTGFFMSLPLIQSTFFDAGSSFTEYHYAATLIIPALFALIEQDLAQRFFAAKSARIAAASAFGASSALLLFSSIPLYFGMQAKILGLTIAEGTSPLIMSIHYFTNDFVTILAACGIVAAITSTADSLLCAISSNIAQDFHLPFLSQRKNFEGIRYSQAITLCVGLGTLVASYLMPRNIITILVESYALSVNCLLIPLLYVYCFGHGKKSAAYGALFGGFISFVGIQFMPVFIGKDLVPLACSLIGFLIGHQSHSDKKLV